MGNTDLSRVMAYALRHAPQEFGIELDQEGWVDIEELIRGLNSKDRFKDIRKEDIIDVVRNCNKKRYEVNGNRVRACYGHSVQKRVYKEEKEPPKVLYHGTDRKFLESITEHGIKSMSRQYVHLSEDKETARMVGARHGENTVILVINAEQAFKDGIKFYYGNDTTWLSDDIPGKYIESIIDI